MLAQDELFKMTVIARQTHHDLLLGRIGYLLAAGLVYMLSSIPAALILSSLHSPKIPTWAWWLAPALIALLPWVFLVREFRGRSYLDVRIEQGVMVVTTRSKVLEWPLESLGSFAFDGDGVRIFGPNGMKLIVKKLPLETLSFLYEQIPAAVAKKLNQRLLGDEKLIFRQELVLALLLDDWGRKMLVLSPWVLLVAYRYQMDWISYLWLSCLVVMTGFRLLLLRKGGIVLTHSGLKAPFSEVEIPWSELRSVHCDGACLVATTTRGRLKLFGAPNLLALSALLQSRLPPMEEEGDVM